MDALGIGKAIDLARDILTPLGHTLSDVWSGAIGDRVAAWRARNALSYQPLLNQEATRLGLKLNPAKIPDRFAFAWFEEATKQDEPELQVLFARLLTRAADENASTDPDRRMIDVIARLTPADAALFQRLYSDQPFPGTGSYSDTKGLGEAPGPGFPVDWLEGLLRHVTPVYSPVSLDNLALQGCIARQWRLNFDQPRGRSTISFADPEQRMRAELSDNIRHMVKQREYIDATELGLALYQAIRE